MAHRLQKGQGLNVTDRTAYFDDGHVDRLTGADTCTPFHEILDFVGDMRNDLNRLAQVVATAFFFEDAFVYLARCEVVGLAHTGFNETLVMAEIEVSFGTIFRHVHLAVLERRHGAGVHVQVRVQFDEGDFEAARFEERSE